MKTAQLLMPTTKETPADAELISHQLMIRAGLIRKLASGLYTWLPLGLKVLTKVEQIVREEMNNTGGQEIRMPLVQPSELWEETGRWGKYGAELLRIEDRHQRSFCLGPTHEEVITDLVRNNVDSYKQLPICLYQIQNKFRDEIRPRFGIMRAREFLMKDAYSFHSTQESLEQTYQQMYQAYSKIFTRIGLNFRPVLADSGNIGGAYSHEFHVLAPSGEDCIAYSDQSDYAANIELAEAIAPKTQQTKPTQTLEKIDTPAQRTIEEITQHLNIKPEQTVKTLIVEGEDDKLIALVLRGDHELNEIKAEKLPQIATPLTMASEEKIKNKLKCDPGFIGPIELKIPTIVDHSAYACSDFICGANENGKHYQGANWQRDCDKPTLVTDLRNVKEGDPSPDGKGNLKLTRGIEVGHIFQLGTEYSESMNCKILNENGKHQTMIMGCYGIGVSRIVAAAIEQHNDERGIIWPQAIAPFDVAIVPIHAKKSSKVQQACEAIYEQLQDAGFDVLWDNRDGRPGGMFADMDLIGIPHRIVIGEKGLEKGEVEYKNRKSGEVENFEISTTIDQIKKRSTT